MSDHEVKMIILSTDNLDESIDFYTETLGMSLKFRDGAHFAALDGGLTEDEWEDARSSYLAEYHDIGTGPEARGPGLFRVTEEPDRWLVEQILDDPEGDHDWRITAELDLTATDEEGEVVLVVTGLGPAS